MDCNVLDSDDARSCSGWVRSGASYARLLLERSEGY